LYIFFVQMFDEAEYRMVSEKLGGWFSSYDRHNLDHHAGSRRVFPDLRASMVYGSLADSLHASSPRDAPAPPLLANASSDALQSHRSLSSALFGNELAADNATASSSSSSPSAAAVEPSWLPPVLPLPGRVSRAGSGGLPAAVELTRLGEAVVSSGALNRSGQGRGRGGHRSGRSRSSSGSPKGFSERQQRRVRTATPPERRGALQGAQPEAPAQAKEMGGGGSSTMRRSSPHSTYEALSRSD
jgi:hypothetical protein